MARCSAALTDAQTAEQKVAMKVELMDHWWVVSSAAKKGDCWDVTMVAKTVLQTADHWVVRWVEMKGASTADKTERM